MRFNAFSAAGFLALALWAAGCNSDNGKESDSGWVPNDDPDNPSESEVETSESETSESETSESETSESETSESESGESGETGDCTEYETYYYDNDGDGWGDPDKTADYCTDEEVPPYWVDNSYDCDDSNSGEPVWVDDDASSGGTGSYTYPFQTVQEGIDEADVCVYVMDGYYNEDIDFSGKDILVWGVDGAESTVIEGTGTTSVVTIANGESSDAVLQGFTIMGGTGTEEIETDAYTCDCTTVCEETIYRYYGCGVYVEQAEPQLVDLIIAENECETESTTEEDEYTTTTVTSYGGAIAVINGAPTLESVDMIENYAYTGGAIYMNSGSTVESVWSETMDNGAGVGGGYYSVGDLTVWNSILCGNDATVEGGAGVDVAGGDAYLYYTNLVGNSSSDANLTVTDAGSVDFQNSIITDNGSGDEVYTDDGTTLVAYYNNVYDDNWSGYYSSQSGSNGNISVDSDFSSYSGDCQSDDFTLASTSSLIDAGDPSDTDADGTTADIGAFGGANGDW